MVVGVDESGKQNAATQLDDLGLHAYQRGDLDIRSDRNDSVPRDRHRLGDRSRFIDGDDLAAAQNQIGRTLRGRLDESRASDEDQQKRDVPHVVRTRSEGGKHAANPPVIEVGPGIGHDGCHGNPAMGCTPGPSASATAAA